MTANVDFTTFPDLFEEDSESSRRTLVTVQRVLDIHPIVGRDRIELATILGYRVIVKKGEFQIGDLCVYHEVDSYVPVDVERYAFLAKDATEKADKPRTRIKTMRLKTPEGPVFSQGLALPLGILPSSTLFDEGDDVTQMLNVIKYPETPQHGSGGSQANGINRWPPDAPPKTDEDRLQSHPYLLREMVGLPGYITMKMDGSSVTAIRRADGSLVVCSRNREIVLDDTAMDGFNQIVRQLELNTRLPPGVTIQGELCGPKMNGNKMGLDKLHLYVFNVYVDGVEFGYPENVSFCQRVGLEFVPVIDASLVIGNDVADFVAKATGLQYGNNTPAEGIVVRLKTPRKSERSGIRLSVKAINPEFELKYG